MGQSWFDMLSVHSSGLEAPSKRIAVLLACLLTAAQANAVPITYELSTYGRLQSGELQIDPLNVALRYTFDSDTADREPSNGSGSFESLYPAVLQIGSESTTLIGGVGQFVNFEGSTQAYTVAAVGTQDAFLLGRRFVVGTFVFLDRDADMLQDDSLPSIASVERAADGFFSDLTFFSVSGDPNFPTEYTKFNICDATVINGCVYAPMKLQKLVSVSEPTLLSLVLAGFLAFGTTRRRHRHTSKNDGAVYSARNRRLTSCERSMGRSELSR